MEEGQRMRPRVGHSMAAMDGHRSWPQICECCNPRESQLLAVARDRAKKQVVGALTGRDGGTADERVMMGLVLHALIEINMRPATVGGLG